MKKHWMEHVIKIAILLAIVIAGFGQAVLQLWNHLMPNIFGLPRISFWQAVGLLGLCWILFGRGFLGRPIYRAAWRRNMRERWEKMTPEQRQYFRKGLMGLCRQSGEPRSEANAQPEGAK